MTTTTLATDLDGTLIPLNDSREQHDALREIGRHLRHAGMRLVFVTGRSFELTMQAMDQFDLPRPDAVLCDVGSTMFHRVADRYEQDATYRERLLDRQLGWTNQKIAASLLGRVASLTLQPAAKQAEFKCSFDFPAEQFDEILTVVNKWIQFDQLPLTPIASVDPETGVGLLDLLPADVNKGFALQAWAQSHGLPLTSIVYCGDSGNDSAAMSVGIRGVLVGNADAQLRADHRKQSEDACPEERPSMYLASGCGPQGVLEGLLHHTRSGAVSPK